MCVCVRASERVSVSVSDVETLTNRQKAATITPQLTVQVCVDPVRQLITVLLTNRVYPRADATSMAKIHYARQRFNNAVRQVVDGPAS